MTIWLPSLTVILKKFKQLGYKNGAMASPIGLELKIMTITRKSANSICSIGALDWRPNRKVLIGLHYVWPSLSKDMPDLKFHIAGRNNTPTELLNANIKTSLFMVKCPMR